MLVPVALKKTNARELEIVWNDGTRQNIPLTILRRECPCATCREKALGVAQETHKLPHRLPVLTEAELTPLDLVAMHPVGNYGYSLHFSDGHGTGIYTLEFLRSLG